MAVKDAEESVRDKVDYVTKQRGGARGRPGDRRVTTSGTGAVAKIG